MTLLAKGRYHARLTTGEAGIAQALALRARAFGQSGHDRFDALCSHLLIQDARTGALVCCLRLLVLPDGRAVTRSYSAQVYDLTPLSRRTAPMAEIGRFCIHPDRRDPDILRVVWGALTRLVDADGVTLLFGCASFAGTDPAPYRDAFAMLAARHLAPPDLRPGIKSPEVFRYGARLRHLPDRRKGLAQMPPLLRSYLLMGGRVSDHAVIDRQMNTLHVFTGLEIAAIPPARKRLLRAIAAAPH